MTSFTIDAEDVPEHVGQNDEIVGIDEFVLHYALWSNAYSTRLHQAGIRFDPDVKTLRIPYGLNYNIQIYNPVAGFFQAVTWIGLIALSELKFRQGKMTEISGKVGSEHIKMFGFATTDSDITLNMGYSSICKDNINRTVDDIHKLTHISAQYNVKSDEAHEGCVTGTRWTKKGEIRESRSIRFIHEYIRRDKAGRGENILVLDKQMVDKCHEQNYIVHHRELFKLRSKLKSNVPMHQIVLGLYLYLLGNQVTDINKGRFFPMSYLEKYFQIVSPKMPKGNTEEERDLYAFQCKHYKKVHTSFIRDLRLALDKMKELKLITGWKAIIDKQKKDPRVKTDFVNLSKATGLQIWM